ncbi:MAG TPA: hypothetical protein ENH82_09435 [bacterium]|nr:hypothetical protein [bacterium]
MITVAIKMEEIVGSSEAKCPDCGKKFIASYYTRYRGSNSWWHIKCPKCGNNYFGEMGSCILQSKIRMISDEEMKRNTNQHGRFYNHNLYFNPW